MHAAISTAPADCLHCGQESPHGEQFCCAGCESVFGILKERGLTHFYDLQREMSFSPPRPINIPQNSSLPISELKGISRARFYIEGIHCLGCLWLLEKLPELGDHIAKASLDLRHQILEVEITEKGDWQSVIQLVEKLGYRLRALDPKDTEAKHFREIDQRRQLLRVGVAGFSAGNIMLLAVSIYAGATQEWHSLFGWLSFALSLPALTFSAWPLYRSAVAPLRKGRISVDLPIVFALAAGGILSLYSLIFSDGSQLYFDALTMLVFLLLASRYFLTRIREDLASKGPCLAFLGSERYQRKNEKVTAEDLAIDEFFTLSQWQILPVDSALQSTHAYFDLSLLTGESIPVKFLQGDIIEAGSRLLDSRTELKVRRTFKESRLHNIFEQVRHHELQRNSSVAFADRIGKYFAYGVLFLAFLVVSFAPQGIERALALVIVTCPCVLAFAVPLSLVKCLQRAAMRGIVFRNAEKIEELANSKQVFIDKTGTLTTGDFTVIRWHVLSGSEAEIKIAVRSLEEFSQHPIAKSLVRYLANIAPAPVEDFHETPSVGVRGKIGGKLWEITGLAEKVAGEGNRVVIFCDEHFIAHVTLGDRLREDSADAVNELRKEGVQLSLLSGDRRDNVHGIAEKLKIESWSYGLTPEEKADVVRGAPNSVMVGDGANDAIAFKAASIGVAVHGAMDLSLKNADVVLTKPGLQSLVEAIRLSKSTMRLLRTNFIFTLSYNLLAGILAITGFMQPLWAAILMPLSALTVFFYTEWFSRKRFL